MPGRERFKTGTLNSVKPQLAIRVVSGGVMRMVERLRGGEAAAWGGDGGAKGKW